MQNHDIFELLRNGESHGSMVILIASMASRSFINLSGRYTPDTLLIDQNIKNAILL